ncbi:hypothetical protein ACFX4U_20560, partial [Kosakonia sp. YIM B13588]
LHGDVLMWLMKTLLTSWCINQRGAGQMNQGPTFYPCKKTVRDDIKTGSNNCNGLAAINNRFYRFNFKLFGITFTAHSHLGGVSPETFEQASS